MEIKEHNSLKEQSKQVLSIKINIHLYQQLKTQIGEEKLGQKELELEQAYKEIAQDKER
ncbi:39492_t:CDS:2 [Gigaspora margarita]|uniref:39492_t:CDS:1 n=1 Tax=Gigaspora margarita TaxID=4874 RepID=A0ABM8VWD5_GIGMA|nr:39492_t:CDS:2 [Gigaspora margarita]